MDIQAYISSGVIENYVLGLATPEESQELEQLCALYPEIREARAQAEEALESYALLHAVKAPEQAKENILSALKQLGGINEAGEEGTLEPIVMQKINKRPSLSVFIAVAASLLLIVSVVFHFVNIKQYKQQIAALEQEKTELIAQHNSFMAQIDMARNEIALIESPSIRSIALDGVPGHEKKHAMLYWNSQSKEVYLKMPDLPELPTDKQYQLWAIVDGQPISAGVYDGQKSEFGVQKMAAISRAEMFAITIEKAGGSEVPTLEQMVVAGKT